MSMHTDRDAQLSWNAFISNSSFHGCRFIFDDGKQRLRKLTWVLCVAVAVTLFTYQVISRFEAYFRHDSNVNVAVEYSDEVSFPAVTICNQNSFRLTSVNQFNMVEALQATFDTPFGANTTLNMKEQNWTLLSQETAHKMSDFISSCYWQGRLCDERVFFREIATDYGWCIIFNTQALTTSKRGSSEGLRLTVNIEQYEYAWGPHPQAGVKVLLHSPEVLPLVGTLGFAAAPGTQTLISIRREEVQSLPQPYGLCSEAAKPRANCVLECMTAMAIDYCGCRDVYMEKQNDTEVCSTERALNCLASVDMSTMNCPCPLPCHRVSYFPELSNAAFSRFALRSVLPPNQTERDALRSNYVTARELAQRLIPGELELNRKLLGPIWNVSQAYTRVSRDIGLLTGDATYVMGETGIRALPLEFMYAIRQDTVVLYSQIDSLSALQKYPTFDDTTPEVTNFLSSLDELQTTVFDRVEVYDACEHREFMYEPGPFKDECDALFKGGNAAGYQARQAMNTFLVKMGRLSMEYLYSVKRVFMNTTEMAEHKYEFNECMELFAHSDAYWPARLQAVFTAIDMFIQADWNHEKTQQLRSLITTVNTSLGDMHILLNASRYEICDWYRDSVHLNSTLPGVYLSTQMVKARIAHSRVADIIGNTVQIAADLNSELSSHGDQYFSIFGAYLDGKGTKSELLAEMKSPRNRRIWERIRVKSLLLDDYLSEIMSIYTDAEKTMVAATSSYLSHDLPLGYVVMRRLALVQLAETAGEETPQRKYVNRLIAEYEANPEASLLNLTDVVYRRYGQLLHDSLAQLTALTMELQDLVKMAEQHLEQYVETNALNEDFVLSNFLKLDIYYPELSYVKISQHKAFEFISLLSEVGGFLGLLLGASVLTVCELVDFLALTCLRRCRGENVQDTRITHDDNSMEKNKVNVDQNDVHVIINNDTFTHAK